MNFRQATDSLFLKVSHADMAKALGVSVAAIRQARLRPEASAHRRPPRDWKQAVIRLSQERVDHYRKLIAEVHKASQKRIGSEELTRR